jgi:uncharacterized protein with ParB-like and HNH nuclease domain
MKANAAPLLAVFEKKLRLEVPLFQRQYVWSLNQQWEPLWEDINRKFEERIMGRVDAPVHFLGAIVLDQKQTPTTHVDKRQIIDGQQRLTTLQIFLSAFRDLCTLNDCVDLAKECDSFILNKGMMANPEIDKFKVYPTQLDRTQFEDVVTSGSRQELERKHPITWRRRARHPNPRPRMIEAYVFFSDQLKEFFLGVNGQPPIASDQPLANRFEECFQTLKNALQIVVIDLEEGDDAQVIFETLNARGEPLLPADLLRNYIFLRAARLGEDQEALYNQYWRRFDDPFWRTEVRQGRLTRPRSDLFMQHFLSSRQCTDIPVKHLFVEYKFWIDRQSPFPNVTAELATIARQGDHFRRILEPQRGDPVYNLVTFTDCFDVRTTYPFLLYLLESNLSESDWIRVSVTIESYLMRRAICGLTTKNYNRIFLTLIRVLRDSETTPQKIQEHLLSLVGESTEWPSDDKFRESWKSRHAYETLQNPRIVYILKKLSNTYLNARMEEITIETPLTVEHILPQMWIEHWPLPDGSRGLNYIEMMQRLDGDTQVEATRKRMSLLQTMGNLTILTQPLNSAVSNSSWNIKKPALMQASLLPINQQLVNYEIWDENTIQSRSNDLFTKALSLWPRPGR